MGEDQPTKWVRRGKWPGLKMFKSVEASPARPASPVDLGASSFSQQMDPMQAGRFGVFASWLKRKLR
jgi:hypothetical protein